MRILLSRLLLLSIVVAGIVFAPSLSAGGGKSTVRGWLSDEGCAGDRARSGKFTGTNPDCAKKCVHNGKKIVLVDPEHKRLLTIANQDAAREQVGDYVEINGELDEQARSLRIDSLKLLEKGRAMCDVPVKKKT
jgi:hypothetical protein